MRKALAVWTLLCSTGWLVFGLEVEQEEAQCRDAGDFLCLDPGLGLLLVGIPMVAVWFVGALVVALVVWVRGNSARRRAF